MDIRLSESGDVLVQELRRKLKLPDDVSAIRRALALLKVCTDKRFLREDGTITVIATDGEEVSMVLEDE